MANWGDSESPLGSGEAMVPGSGAGRITTTGDDAMPDAALDFDFAALLSIADTLPVMIAYCDTHETYRFVNQPIVDWFGLPRRDILGRQIADIMPEKAYADRREAIADALSGTARTLSSEYDHPTRGRVYTKATYRPHRDANGATLGLVMIVEDVTDRQQSERALLDKVEAGSMALADRDARLQAIFDAVQTVIVLMRPDGMVLETNDRAPEWRPHGAEGETGVYLWQTPTLDSFPEHADRARALVARAAAGETVIDEVELEIPGRGSAYLSSTFQPIRGEDGSVRYILLEARDNTDLRRAQDQLRQAQKMEALGQLTGGIAHDFNNLLTVVVGGLDMITRRELDEKTRAYAVNALAAAERGARLTGQLLAFSRVQKLEVRPCDMGALVEETRPLLRNVLGPGIEKKFVIDADVGAALADPTQLEVALLNLVVNARDAMQKGGCIIVSLHEVEIGEDDPELDPGRYVELAVEDTGEGMDETVRARVFEPFFTTKDIGKGTGLGLSMVYGMARQSGGTARIESRLGEGTRVAILLRRADAAANARAETPANHLQRKSRGRSVLVVDDDDAVRTYMVETLREMGFVVREAAGGGDALALQAEQPADLVVLDYIMPGLSGADVARAILRDHPDQPLLFVSGYSETEQIRSVAPEARFLAKPFRAEALVEAIDAMTDAD